MAATYLRASLPPSMTGVRRWRLRLPVLPLFKWRLQLLWRFNLPDAVILKRFFDPLCVFILGMARPAFTNENDPLACQGVLVRKHYCRKTAAARKEEESGLPECLCENGVWNPTITVPDPVFAQALRRPWERAWRSFACPSLTAASPPSPTLRG